MFTANRLAQSALRNPVLRSQMAFNRMSMVQPAQRIFSSDIPTID